MYLPAWTETQTPAQDIEPYVDRVHYLEALALLGRLPDDSVDAVVTDPPYGLAFMGKRWDYDVPGVAVWAEALRVLKPGGHLLAFAGTRTQHRMAVNIENAGFEIRDMIAWVYASGFPKSHDISKAIDKEAGVEREKERAEAHITAPATPEAAQWDGWGSALKPAMEPITVARKPLAGTLAGNTLQWGVGGLNISACRVGAETLPPRKAGQAKIGTFIRHKMVTPARQGRWPANLVHDGSEDVVRLFPVTGGAAQRSGERTSKDTGRYGKFNGQSNVIRGHNDNGGSAARFFYCAKATPSERGKGNHHPTVKPLALMAWLIQLVTPAGAIVLDPFAGSGSTAVAAKKTGRRYICGDITREYVEIARERVRDADPFQAKTLENGVQQLSLFEGLG